MKKTIVATANAPEAIGPYSQGAVFEHLVFTSGQLPVDPATGTIPEGIALQTKQALKNVEGILTAAGSSMEQALKLTVFLADINDFAAMNEVYATFFHSDPPCRSAFQIVCLPKNVLVEIEAIAYR